MKVYARSCPFQLFAVDYKSLHHLRDVFFSSSVYLLCINNELRSLGDSAVFQDLLGYRENEISIRSTEVAVLTATWQDMQAAFIYTAIWI